MSSGNSPAERVGPPANEETDIGEEGQFRVVDRRKFLDTEDIVATAEDAEEKPRFPSYVEELQARMTDMEQRFEEKKRLLDEELGRTRARLESEHERRVDEEKRRLILPLLEVLDNLERALESSASDDALRQGVEMTVQLFRSKLQAQGVEAIPMLGEHFDPNLGQAIGVVGVGGRDQDGLVVEEYQRGYLMDGRLLRPAQVRVGKYEEDPAASG